MATTGEKYRFYHHISVKVPTFDHAHHRYWKFSHMAITSHIRALGYATHHYQPYQSTRHNPMWELLQYLWCPRETRHNPMWELLRYLWCPRGTWHNPMWELLRYLWCPRGKYAGQAQGSGLPRALPIPSSDPLSSVLPLHSDHRHSIVKTGLRWEDSPYIQWWKTLHT